MLFIKWIEVFATTATKTMFYYAISANLMQVLSQMMSFPVTTTEECFSTGAKNEMDILPGATFLL